MKCAWCEFVNLLPIWMRAEVDKLGQAYLEELRLRIGSPPQLVLHGGHGFLDRCVTSDDLLFCINVASRYSPWAAATLAKGYITAPGGHRIGASGVSVTTDEKLKGMRTYTSLCLRVARDYSGISGKLSSFNCSMLIIGQPGSGKTTLLRDLVRRKSEDHNVQVCVIDEKGELFPFVDGKMCFPCGKSTDVLSGTPKGQGIEIMLRNMSPQIIAVDEITAEEDCRALVHAGWCGIKLIATAHAAELDDLYKRPVYKSIMASGLFDVVVILRPDKTWRVERMK